MLCLPVLLLTASINGAANSLWIYKYGFEKYDIGQTTGLAEAELEKAAARLIGYFNSDEEFISLTVVKDGQPFVLFNQREVAHLNDVKELFWLGYWVLLGTMIYTVGYAGVSLFWRKGRYRQRLARGMVGGCSITLSLMLALGLGTLLGFDQLFWQFHLISFANDLWQLDPTRDYLIMLFPQGFWYNMTVYVALATAAVAVIAGGVAVVYLKRTREQTS